MNIEINPIDLLSEDQQEKIAEAYTKKVTEAINAIKVSKDTEINLAAIMERRIDSALDDVCDNELINFDAISEKVTSALLEIIKGK